jgi:integrase
MQPKSGMTFEAFVDEWRANVATNLEASTVRAANSHLRAHIIPKLGALVLPEVGAKVVQAFVTSLATRGLSRKTVENILLTLSSVLSKARAWDYACGSFSLGDLTLPRNGVKKEQRSFTATEAGRIIAAAKEPFATLWAIVFMLGLRIGEGIALRVSDLDFERKIIRVRPSVDSVTRKVKACKSDASSADLPMPPQLEVRLHTYLASEHFRHNNVGLLFVNKGWVFLMVGSTPVGMERQAQCLTAVQLRALCRNRCGIRMHALRLESTAMLLEMRNDVRLNHTRNALKRVVGKFNWSRVLVLEPTSLQALDSKRKLVGAVGIGLKA